MTLRDTPVPRGRLRSAGLLLATVAAGLQAGAYFIFSFGVMPGLALGDDRTFVAAMRQFNVSFMNPWFLGSFLAAPLLALVAVVLHLGRRSTTLYWAVVGLLGAAATFVVTGVVHIPLNEAIDAAGPPDRIADLGAVRAAHEATWVSWNLVRVLTSTASLAALAYASLRFNRDRGY